MLKLWCACLACVLVLPACSGDDDDEMMPESSTLGAPNPNGTAGDDETPPTSTGTKVEAWLKGGAYKDWTCEDVEHPQMKVSPHGHNRVCSNALAADFAGDVGDERPVGTASVKELYDDASKIVGYAVGVKIAAKSADGDNWYWYERTPDGVVADGLGSAGTANSICVGCHAGAGMDATHSVTKSSDYVYLQVMK